MRTSLRIVLLLLGVHVAAGAPASAQLPGINVHIGARGGWFAPLGKIGEDASGRETKLSQGPAFGASIELDIPVSPIDVRANVDATMGRSIELQGTEVPGTEVDLLILTGDLVFRPIPRLVVAQPYLLVGAGIKKYSTEGSFEDDSQVTGHLGLGADLKLGGFSLMAEVSDYISSFKEFTSGDKHLQNDVFVMIGFRIGIL